MSHGSSARAGLRSRRHAALRPALGLACALACVGASAGSARAATPSAACPDVYVLFARGTFEPRPLGVIVGPAFTRAVQSNLPGESVSVWGDPYGANAIQTSAGPGATDMTQEFESDTAACPDATFVLGGYSQGASVVDIALGIRTLLGVGQTIPTADDSKIAAILTWGNPLRLFGHETIAGAKPELAARTTEYCNAGDPICANGFDILAHLAYGTDGKAADGGVFAADEVKSGA